MKTPEEHLALPLEYVAELAMEMHLMRAECCEAAASLTSGSANDEVNLGECVVLEEALAEAQLLLQRAIATIKRRRNGPRM